MIVFPDRDEQRELNDRLTLIDRWYVAVSEDGSLWLQPRKDVIDLREFCTLLKRIHRLFRDHRFKILAFHFDGVQASRSLWLIILRLLRAFAKIMQADCRVIRDMKGPGLTSSDRVAAGSSSVSMETRPQAKPMMRLSGITIRIEPPVTAAHRLGKEE